MEENITGTMVRTQYKGKDILIADYQTLDREDFVNAVRENRKAWQDMIDKGVRDVLVLTDISNAYLDEKVMKAFQEITQVMKPNTKASAVVGVTGIRKIMLDAVNLVAPFKTKAFKNREDALDWLVGLTK